MTDRNKGSLGAKVRAAERGIAKKLLRWSMQRKGHPLPPDDVMDRGSQQVVDKAHSILGRTGQNIISELKETKDAFKKAYRDNDEDE